MASMQGQRNRSAQSRTDSAVGHSANGAESQLELVQERVGEWVAERPWTMVGAATGIGVMLGVATRTRATHDFGRMLAGTASGIAVRYALNTLAQMFEPGRHRNDHEETRG